MLIDTFFLRKNFRSQQLTYAISSSDTLVIKMSMSVGQTIQQRRVDLALSQRVLAEKMGIMPSTLSNIERGVRPPTPEEVKILSRIIGPLPCKGVPNPNVKPRNVFKQPSRKPAPISSVDAGALREAMETCKQQYGELMRTFDTMFDILANQRYKRIYVIQQGRSGPLKIGTSFDPESRMRTLQTGVIDGLTLLHQFDGDEQIERQLHARFNQYRLAGEWFSPSSEILNWVRSIGGTVRGDAAATIRIESTQAEQLSFYP
jgi:transcriptional regulator with XRE-family HTH domain